MAIDSSPMAIDVRTIGALGTIYLGGYNVRTLAAAGLIDEHEPGAVARADALFRSAVAPWCSSWF
jgi:hypothetical protein